VLTKALALEPDSIGILRAVSMAQLELGRHREALPGLEKVWATGDGDWEMRLDMARCHAALNNVDAALAVLTEIKDERGFDKSLEAHEFDALRKDPRYISIIERANQLEASKH
jgi:thioredoxin-like negative regulator of GroEL